MIRLRANSLHNLVWTYKFRTQFPLSSKLHHFLLRRDFQEHFVPNFLFNLPHFQISVWFMSILTTFNLSMINRTFPLSLEAISIQSFLSLQVSFNTTEYDTIEHIELHKEPFYHSTKNCYYTQTPLMAKNAPNCHWSQWCTLEAYLLEFL